MEIIVERPPPDKQGDDIVDPLLSTEEVGLSRGRAELDENSSAHQLNTLVINYRAGLQLGQLVEVVDLMLARVWKGKIIGITQQIGSVRGDLQVVSVLDIKYPTELY